jgi:hypothetical protein
LYISYRYYQKNRQIPVKPFKPTTQVRNTKLEVRTTEHCPKRRTFKQSNFQTFQILNPGTKYKVRGTNTPTLPEPKNIQTFKQSNNQTFKPENPGTKYEVRGTSKNAELTQHCPNRRTFKQSTPERYPKKPQPPNLHAAPTGLSTMGVQVPLLLTYRPDGPLQTATRARFCLCCRLLLKCFGLLLYTSHRYYQKNQANPGQTFQTHNPGTKYKVSSTSKNAELTISN